MPILINPQSIYLNAFTCTVKTDNSGTSNSDQFTFPTVSGGTYNCTVYRSDGTSSVITTWDDAAWTHTFPSSGTYTIRVVGTFTGFYFNGGGDAAKLINISQFGILNPGNQGGSFNGCSNLTVTASDILDLTGISTLLSMFSGCTSLLSIPSIISFDVTNINVATNMFLNSGLSSENYNLLLTAWSQQSLQTSVPFHGGSAKWEIGLGGQSRFDMISVYSWIITDGGQEDATMGAWYNAHNVLKSTANPADGTGVTTWSDLSDNANDAAEATNPPLFKTNIANGEPMLLFNGSNSRIDVVADPSLNGLFDGGGFFICAVKPLSDGQSGQGRIVSQGGGNTHISLRSESSGACKLRLVKAFAQTIGVWQTTNLDINIDEVNIIAVDYDSSDAANDPVFYINSTTPVSLTEATTPVGLSSKPSSIQIGNALSSIATFDGYIGDLGFFRSSPSSTVRNEMINYLATKFGVTLT
jgi:hypothetical protein